MSLHDIEVAGGPPAVSLEVLAEHIRSDLADTDVLRAIVFGSFARGEADAAGDLDLVLIERSGRPFPERGMAHKPLFRLGPAVDLLVYTPAEYEHMKKSGNPLIERVEQEGVEIHAQPQG